MTVAAVVVVACVVWKRAEKFVKAYPKYRGAVVFGRFGGVINLRLSLSARRVRHKTRRGARRGRECLRYRGCERGVCDRAGKKQCYTHAYRAAHLGFNSIIIMISS